MDLRRGPWTVDEDLTLINYVATHGEGRWNTLALSAGNLLLLLFLSFYYYRIFYSPQKQYYYFIFQISAFYLM